MASKQDNPEQVAEQAVEQVQQTVDEEQDKGYHGATVDPTPRENYTVSGVVNGAPTPETDDGAAEEARKLRAAGL